METKSHYKEVIEGDYGLYAVHLEEGGWSIASGPGTTESIQGPAKMAGYHLPVRFQNAVDTLAAIFSGPTDLFEISTEGMWVKHALACGATSITEY